MIKEQGIIEKVRKHTAQIRVNRTSACAACKSRDSCNMEKRDIIVEVVNDLQAKPGDKVELSMPEGAVIKISILVYFLPIIALMIGAFTGASLGERLHLNSSLFSILGGLLAMSLIFLFLKKLEKIPNFKKRYQAQITRIISRENTDKKA